MVAPNNITGFEEMNQKLCDELNETETLFPRTNLRLIYNVG